MKRKFLFSHLETARVYSKLSHCNRLKVGALIVKNNNPIAMGYNGRPSGEPNVGELDGITHPDVIHAERNALKKILRSTESSVGATIFVTHSPCRQCAIDIVDAGITNVFFGIPYRDRNGIEYLVDHNINVYFIDPDTDVIYKYSKLTYSLVAVFQERF